MLLRGSARRSRRSARFPTSIVPRSDNPNAPRCTCHSSLLHLLSGFRLLINVRRSKFTRRIAKTDSGVMNKVDFAVGIGGENGQGIASTGNILALIFARRGLHLNAYNAYQSIIRGGHTFLTIRASDGPVRSMGDKLDVLIPLNQDSMDRHLRLMQSGTRVVYDGDKLKPGETADGVQLCPMPMKQLCGANKLAANTAALGAVLQMLGIESEPLEAGIAKQFKKKGDAVVAENVGIARGGYQHAAEHFKPFPFKTPKLDKPKGILTGNIATAMGGAAAGVKFYAAYPMSPSTGVLMWMATHARQLGIMVRQVEDEIG